MRRLLSAWLRQRALRLEEAAQALPSAETSRDEWTEEERTAVAALEGLSQLEDALMNGDFVREDL